MPAETHQHGRTADPETVTMLLCTLLSDADEITEDTALADLGLDTGDLDDLWDAVREELAERTVGPEIDLGEFDPQMTVSDAARVMASLLAGAGAGDGDRGDDE
jgi:erythromycin esterase-like protein